MMIKILLCTFFCASALTIKEEVPVKKASTAKTPTSKTIAKLTQAATQTLNLHQKTSEATLSESAVHSEGAAWVRKQFAGFDENLLKYAQNSGLKELVLEVFNDTVVQHAGQEWLGKQDVGYPARANKAVHEALLQQNVVGSMSKGLFPKGFDSDPATKELTSAVFASIARHPEHISTMKSALVEYHQASAKMESKAPVVYKEDPSKLLGLIVAICYGMVVAPETTMVAFIYTVGTIVAFAGYGLLACAGGGVFTGFGALFGAGGGKHINVNFNDCAKQVVTGKWAMDPNAIAARQAIGEETIGKFKAMNALIGNFWWGPLQAGAQKVRAGIPWPVSGQ